MFEKIKKIIAFINTYVYLIIMKPNPLTSPKIFSVIFLVMTLIFFNIRADSRIYKKIHSNGTVEYYNKISHAGHNRKLINTPYNGLITIISKKNKIDPYLIKCVIKVESNFKANAVSKAGAMGLMQLMQSTAEYYSIKNPFDPEENLNAGISHLASLMKYFKNDIELALAAYHAGRTRVAKKMKIPPIRSTINYVNKIVKLYSGKKSNSSKIKKLYTKLTSDGTLHILSK